MFFGIEVKSNQNQAKPLTLANTLKLSQAVLDPSKVNGKKEPVSLVVEYEKKQFILCVLDPKITWQSPLDLVFEGGSEVKFFVRGSGTVHLTGYESFDDLDDMSMSMSSDDEEEPESESEKVVEVPKKTKTLAQKSPKESKTNGVSKPGAAKKASWQKDVEGVEDDEDSSDDDDFDVADLDDDDDDDDDENDDDDDDDDEDMSDDDEMDDEEDSSEE